MLRVLGRAGWPSAPDSQQTVKWKILLDVRVGLSKAVAWDRRVAGYKRVI